MTLLDDYEARYRLRGIEIAAQMLRGAPSGVLTRTGVDGLLFSVSAHTARPVGIANGSDFPSSLSKGLSVICRTPRRRRSSAQQCRR